MEGKRNVLLLWKKEFVVVVKRGIWERRRFEGKKYLSNLILEKKKKERERRRMYLEKREGMDITIANLG